MNYNINLTPKAQSDLKEIFRYIAVDLQSIQNATGQLDRLEKAISSLEQMPERYRVYDKEPWRSRNLRIMTVDNYLVFTDWNTMYHLYINGVYQLLLNTSFTGCQYRFTRSGDVFYRSYNLNENTWNEWNHLSSRIPESTISNDMIIEETISYEKL